MATSHTLTLEGLMVVVWYCDLQPAGPHISHDGWSVKVKKTPLSVVILWGYNFMESGLDEM